MRKTRLIYEYISVEEKKEVLKLLRMEKEELEKEMKKNMYSYPRVINQVLSDTLDKWRLEISELEDDINNDSSAK